MKTKISTEWLSGCAGCHVAIVDLHEKLLNMLDSIEFVRIPVLMDEKEYPEADIGIVEGAVRSEHDREALLKIRKSVKTLIAFGTCAVYRGPSG
ncbi:MAG: F420-nonreducing hydrogenase, partial [Chitinispirillaceae bacterium]|nr:F420-nonreducing hydrogenase [Chitinispirillaceae bacterium]